jgi:tRNA A-37 threonylcarbamoyl transferase component Bud32
LEISPIRLEDLKRYFADLFNEQVSIMQVEDMIPKEEKKIEKELKGFGYGIPYLIKILIGGMERKFVLETVRPGPFGHEHFSDRAQILLWQHSTFNRLPSHVRSIDVGAFTKDNNLKSLGDCKEFFIVTEFVEGEPYYLDLERMKATLQITQLDIERCKALSDYLAKIHSLKSEDAKPLYTRRIRELIGHGECIMGLTDSYPSNLEYLDEKFLIDLEKKCVEWRWKIKRKSYRCSQVHGDFHPWNILFKENVDFTALDRSRGEWGEPADDVTAMTINYLFYSLQTYGKLDGPFKELFEVFWKNYLEKTGDDEILTVVQPFYAWRGLVIASPIWYPTLPIMVRKKIFSFIRNILEKNVFDLKEVEMYLSD